MVEERALSTRTLVLGMIDEDGRLDAGPLYEVAAGCGLTDQQVRLCLRRLVAEGALEHRSGRGRKGSFQAVRAAAGSILPELEYVRYAYRQDRGEAPWDGTWRLASFTVPESRRSARDELRRHLRFLGGASVGGGMYVCANGWEPDVLAAAERLGVLDGLALATTTDLRVGTLTEPTAIAARLWPLEELAADWAALGARLAELPTVGDERARLGAAFARAVEFSEVMERDPLLPPELLPASWPGRTARAALAAEPVAEAGDGPLVAALRRLSVRAVLEESAS